MGILSSLFNGSKTIDKISASADKLVFTDQERSNLHLRFLQAYEPFKVAQRLLSLLVGIPFMFFHCVSMFFLIREKEDIALKIAEANNEALGMTFMIIISFYFAGGTIESFIKKRG